MENFRKERKTWLILMETEQMPLSAQEIGSTDQGTDLTYLSGGVDLGDLWDVTPCGRSLVLKIF